jgi:ribosomal protein L11 methyltransferase
MDNPTQHWHRLNFDLPEAMAEDLASLCHALGSCGSQAEEKNGLCRLVVYFDSDCDMERIRDGIEPFLQRLELSAAGPVERQEECDWQAEWRRFFVPVWATPNLVVRPSWIPLELESGQIEVVIDPQMAFGTGGHESTQLCLRLAESTWRQGGRCLDLGCGSGVLAIAVAKMGAVGVVALDVDPLSVTNTRDNLAVNGIVSGVEVGQGSIEAATGEFDMVLANILSGVLLPMLPKIKRRLKPEGVVVFSGLLAKEGEMFGAAVETAGLRVEECIEKNGWISMAARN